MAQKNEKESRLSDTDVLRSVPREQLVKIAQVVQDKVVPAHTLIFRRGDQGDSFYIINSGKVRVFLRAEDGVETDLNELGPGDSFGEMALLTDEPRSTDIEAVEETQLFILTKKEFDRVLRDHPEVYKRFIKYLTEILRRDERSIQEEAERQYRAPKLSLFDFVFIGAVILIFATIFNLSNPNRIDVMPKFYDAEEIPKVDISLAKAKYDEGETLFVDARPSRFFDQRHIKDAISIPSALFDIMYMMELGEVDKEKKIIVYGRSISTLYDEEVARKLILYGHKNVQILGAGYQYKPLTWGALSRWRKNGYPVEP